MTPAALYDACDAAVAGRPWWRGRRRPVMWLTSPTVTVAARTWTSRHHSPAGDYGYTVAQCRGIRAGLLPVLAGYAADAESAAGTRLMLR